MAVYSKLQLTENARQILEARYLWRDEKGRVCETPAQLFERVAKAIAKPETRGRARWETRFLELMDSGRFLPNTPTLLNAGRKGKRGGQLSACFVLPIQDSLESIFGTLLQAAIIHQSGGGTGFSFSRLRPKGALVRASGGAASGPVSFIRIYDVATETIKQGGARRGANMAVLRVDHPDILEFVDVKRDQKAVTNFNLSVGATDEFMRAVRSDGDFALRDPRDGKAEKTVRAKELFGRIVRAAWECGDPGLIFLDRANLFNPTPEEGAIESTNPCGEQPLLPFESCNLGSLNVAAYFVDKAFDWGGFTRDIGVAVRFLDNVIDVNAYPVKECGQLTRRNRKIGLGIMGFADLLLLLGIPYGAEESLVLGEQIMSALDREAKRASAELAREKGAFPNWKGSLWKELGFPPLRNATVSTVAPTGTISQIVGVSSGIEPIYAAEFVRNILEGRRLRDVPPVVERVCREKGIQVEQLETLKAWRPAAAISVEDHVRMQAVFQKHCDAAVSKTVNLPQKATEADVARAYWLAFELGCKGITVYRDQSRGQQVLCASC